MYLDLYKNTWEPTASIPELLTGIVFLVYMVFIPIYKIKSQLFDNALTQKSQLEALEKIPADPHNKHL